MKRILIVGVGLYALFIGTVAANEDLAVNRLFSDHMVLQRDMPVPVWGTAKPGTKITVKFGQQQKTVETGKDGKWLVRLDALKASAEPAELTIKSLTGTKPVKITDILVGDFPFLFVQPALSKYSDDVEMAPRLWEAQTATLALPNTGMAVTHDISSYPDCHAPNKQEVGRRLALWALAKTYGKKNLVCSGPIYRSMAIVPGSGRPGSGCNSTLPAAD